MISEDQLKGSIPRIDTPINVDYYKNGGILPFVLKELVSKA